MHDIKLIRNDPQAFKKEMSRRGVELEIDHILNLDNEKKGLTHNLDIMRQRRNTVSKEIGKCKKEKIDTTNLEQEMRELGLKMKSEEETERELGFEIKNVLMTLPNLPAEDTPDGLTENENVLLFEEGEKPKFEFELLDHLQLSDRLRILDFSRGGKVTGSGFPVWCGDGALLERALINFMLDLHTTEHGYKEMMTPFLGNRETMKGSGQIPKLEDDMYQIESDDLFLIPTSEVTLINLHRGEIIPEAQMPVKYVSYSPCFRREAGSHGHMTRGFLRVHQFNKVEMVCFVKPERSNEVWEEIANHARKVLQLLELPYRMLRLCAGDMSFNAASCYDLEVWAPAEGGRWLEVSSISNCVDFQSRRAGIRYRPSDGGKPVFPHILNGSGLATSRLMVALLEVYQTEEGSVAIPEVLRKYMAGKTVITAGMDRGVM